MIETSHVPRQLTEMNTDTKKRRRWFSPLRLIDWIDNQESETLKRLFQALLGGAILGLGSLIWTQRSSILDSLSNGTKSIGAVLTIPIHLQLWVVLEICLVVFALIWFTNWLEKRQKHLEENVRKALFENLKSKDLINSSRIDLQEAAMVLNKREIISKINDKLVALKLAVDNFTFQKNPDSNRQQQQDAFWKIQHDYKTYIADKEIYIQDVFYKVEDYYRTLENRVVQFQLAMLDSTGTPLIGYEKVFEKYHQCTQLAEIKRASLERDFQAILGITPK